MKDWKGNEVKDGDTVIRVRVEDDYSFYPSSLFMLVVENGVARKENEVILEKPEERKFIWEEVRRYEVFLQVLEVDGREISYLAYEAPCKAPNGGKLILPLDDPWAGSDIRDSKYITCIEGKSDSQEDYYLHKFKA
jgi:hypothetical protein